MDEHEDRILAEELAALGAASGGSARLVRAVARLMRKNVHEVELRVPLPFDATVQRVSGVLGRAGSRPIETSRERYGEAETLRIVTGGGAGGLNPVVVTARVSEIDGETSAVLLRAAAKEGVIRQRAGEKTALRLAALLSTATGTEGSGRAGEGPGR
ncbi:hypothetical protein [Streptomyces sp. NPDC085466]|uniref:hypothetical protein n=1 Tax=Streptomyces sp. NPDC085466 TaxID=3365725 RepID=UPI0037D40C99